MLSKGARIKPDGTVIPEEEVKKPYVVEFLKTPPRIKLYNSITFP